MIAAAAARLAGSPRRRAAVLGLALGAAALLARRSSRPPATAPFAVVAREHLANGAGLALVEAGSRRLLVGFGREGVRLVADLGTAGKEAP